MNVYIITHSVDVDGLFSALIVKKFFKDLKKDANIVISGYNYEHTVLINHPNGKDRINLLDYAKNTDEIIFTDCTPTQTDHFDKYVIKFGKNLTIIDHHQTTIKFFEDNPIYSEKINLVLETGIGACEIAWKRCYPNEYTPMAVKLASLWDTFNKTDLKRWDDHVVPFQYGLKGLEDFSVNEYEKNLGFIPQLVTTSDYDEDLSALFGSIIRKGKIILEYEKNRNKSVFEKTHFYANLLIVGIVRIDIATPVKDSEKIEFKKVLIATDYNNNSKLIEDALGKEEYESLPIVLLVRPNIITNKHAVTFFSPNKSVDVSEIAKKLGGGGHKYCAGANNISFVQIYIKSKGYYPDNGESIPTFDVMKL
jgi:oligoribonuclease NrnB/cAMP/cGMP phosphodiesterase (DHH superfamily)